MATLTFRRGDSAVYTFAPDDGSGQPVDLTGATARVEISAASACIKMPLSLIGGEFRWAVNDQTMPVLPARAYRAAFVLTWPDGLTDRDDFVLMIEEGC